MAIWKQDISLDRINGWSANTMMETLGIRFTEIGDDWLRGTMPVDAAHASAVWPAARRRVGRAGRIAGQLAAMLSLDPLGSGGRPRHQRQPYPRRAQRHRHRHRAPGAYRPHHAGVGNPHRGRKPANWSAFRASPSRSIAARRRGTAVRSTRRTPRSIADLVLDAVTAGGLWPDGRLLALNSYENRVYQVGIEDASPLVAKFYRPRRWSDAAIVEEHAFAHELAEAETADGRADRLSADARCCITTASATRCTPAPRRSRAGARIGRSPGLAGATARAHPQHRRTQRSNIP